MKDLGQYGAREWLQLRPLQHAIKQWRNDAVQFAYVRRPAASDVQATLVQLRQRLDSRALLAVIAFEQPWVLGWLLRMAARHLRDAVIVVFDNSRSAEARARIRAVCEARETPYIALPPSRTRHINRSHSLAIGWAWHNVIAPLAPARFGFIDHDLIPLEPVSIAERLQGQPFYGSRNQSPWGWHLWAGYSLFDGTAVKGRRLNFMYDFARGLDTGGRNWRALYRHTDDRRLVFAQDQHLPVRDPVDGSVATVQVLDGRWLHIGGISYNGGFEAKAALCEHLAAALDAGTPWRSLLVGGQDAAAETAPRSV